MRVNRIVVIQNVKNPKIRNQFEEGKNEIQRNLDLAKKICNIIKNLNGIILKNLISHFETLVEIIITTEFNLINICKSIR